MSLTQLIVVFGLLGVWAIFLRSRQGPPEITDVALKFTHILPACLQTVLFTYWSTYWPEVLHHVPVIVVLLAYAYSFDLLLNWSLRRPYVPGLGPVPVVLSMNLFVWFPDFGLAASAIAMALASKVFLHSRGHHIFNPAVFGLTVVAVPCSLWPDVFRYHDVSHQFDRPPYMEQLVFLLALIPQVRLGITPVAVGAVIGMLAPMMVVQALIGYRGGPTPWWPAWLLATTLLAGDPATIPTTSIARLLFGLFLGVAFYVVSRAMLFTVETDFFAKIIPIAIANLLVPTFERAGRQLLLRWPTALVTAGNRAYVVTWISFFAIVSLITTVL
jgi:hypothetical protein